MYDVLRKIFPKHYCASLYHVWRVTEDIPETLLCFIVSCMTCYGRYSRITIVLHYIMYDVLRKIFPKHYCTSLYHVLRVTEDIPETLLCFIISCMTCYGRYSRNTIVLHYIMYDVLRKIFPKHYCTSLYHVWRVTDDSTFTVIANDDVDTKS